jgi:hypothetical protein
MVFQRAWKIILTKNSVAEIGSSATGGLGVRFSRAERASAASAFVPLSERAAQRSDLGALPCTVEPVANPVREASTLVITGRLDDQRVSNWLR